MAFSEKIKLEVKKKSAFRCCRCHEIGIDVHHIIPKADGGSDDIDNAAPLCQNCHNRFGANSEKRKEIRQMRDWWYEVVKEKYPSGLKIYDKISEINELVLQIQKENQSSISDLKDALMLKLQEFTEATEVKSQDYDKKIIQQKVSGIVSATTLGDRVHANLKCKKCGTEIGLLIGSNECPNCHTPI